MKRFILLVALLAFSHLLQAQGKRLVVHSYTPSDIGDMRARTAPVTDRNNRLAAMIEVSFSAADSVLFDGIIGEPVHHPGAWIIRVPEGASRLRITVPGYKSIDYSFPETLLPESGRVYLMDLRLETTTKLRTLVLPTFNYCSAQSSFGLLLAFCKKNGFYTHATTDFSLGIHPTSECDAEGMIEGIKRWFTGEVETSRLAFTAGYMRQLFSTAHNSSLYLYAGGGYGYRALLWRMYGNDGGYEYAKVTPASVSGYEVETGLVYRLGGIALLAGVQTNQFKYTEASLGVGFMF